MEKNGKTVAFHSLGCKVNSYESELMLQTFRKNGYEIVTFEQKADIYVVNTCTVTQIADKKSRQLLRRAKRLNPRAVVVAAGCAVETGGIRTATEDIDLAIGNADKQMIVSMVEKLLSERQSPPGKTDGNDRGCAGLSAVSDAIPVLEKPADHTRAFLKIQDGCDQFCSYCVIPYARGRTVSRDPAEILREVSILSEQGVREVVLTGIHLSSYGRESRNAQFFDGRPLIRLIECLSAVDGISRIRLGSLEPRLITQETAECFAALSDPARGGKLCPHFHLSLQSGCDETLMRMNRHYTTGMYAESVELLRSTIDRPAITTDIITGFPGETEAEFEATRRFLVALSLYELHVFPFSRRPGTVAASMPDQLSRSDKERRSSILLTLTKNQARTYRESFLGETLTVLTEEIADLEGSSYLIGHTERYVRVAVPLPTGAGGHPKQDTDEQALTGRLFTGTAVRMLTDEVVLIDSSAKQ